MASILEKMMTVQALLFLIVAPPALASTRFLQQASDQAAPPSPGAFTIAGDYQRQRLLSNSSLTSWT